MIFLCRCPGTFQPFFPQIISACHHVAVFLLYSSPRGSIEKKPWRSPTLFLLPSLHFAVLFFPPFPSHSLVLRFLLSIIGFVQEEGQVTFFLYLPLIFFPLFPNSFFQFHPSQLLTFEERSCFFQNPSGIPENLCSLPIPLFVYLLPFPLSMFPPRLLYTGKSDKRPPNPSTMFALPLPVLLQ